MAKMCLNMIVIAMNVGLACTADFTNSFKNHTESIQTGVTVQNVKQLSKY